MTAGVLSHEGASFAHATEDDCHTLLQGSWKWGPDGHGAILLVNCDCERTYWKKPDNEDDKISRVSGLNSSVSFFYLYIFRPRSLRQLRLIFAFQMSSAERNGPVNLGAAVCAGRLRRFPCRFVLSSSWFDVVTSAESFDASTLQHLCWSADWAHQFKKKKWNVCLLWWIWRSERHVHHGAADQRPRKAPRWLQAGHAHVSRRCREHQSLQAEIQWR